MPDMHEPHSPRDTHVKQSATTQPERDDADAGGGDLLVLLLAAALLILLARL